MKQLTEREQQVLGLIAQGLLYKMVASTLKISKYTVREHMTKILVKLDAHNSPHAVAIAKDKGII